MDAAVREAAAAYAEAVRQKRQVAVSSPEYQVYVAQEQVAQQLYLDLSRLIHDTAPVADCIVPLVGAMASSMKFDSPAPELPLYLVNEHVNYLFGLTLSGELTMLLLEARSANYGYNNATFDQVREIVSLMWRHKQQGISRGHTLGLKQLERLAGEFAILPPNQPRYVTSRNMLVALANVTFSNKHAVAEMARTFTHNVVSIRLRPDDPDESGYIAKFRFVLLRCTVVDLGARRDRWYMFLRSDTLIAVEEVTVGQLDGGGKMVPAHKLTVLHHTLMLSSLVRYVVVKEVIWRDEGETEPMALKLNAFGPNTSIETLRIYGTIPIVSGEQMHANPFAKLHTLEIKPLDDYGTLASSTVPTQRPDFIFPRTPSLTRLEVDESVVLYRNRLRHMFPQLTHVTRWITQPDEFEEADPIVPPYQTVAVEDLPDDNLQGMRFGPKRKEPSPDPSPPASLRDPTMIALLAKQHAISIDFIQSLLIDGDRVNVSLGEALIEKGIKLPVSFETQFPLIQTLVRTSWLEISQLTPQQHFTRLIAPLLGVADDFSEHANRTLLASLRDADRAAGVHPLSLLPNLEALRWNDWTDWSLASMTNLQQLDKSRVRILHLENFDSGSRKLLTTLGTPASEFEIRRWWWGGWKSLEIVSITMSPQDRDTSFAHFQKMSASLRALKIRFGAPMDERSDLPYTLPLHKALIPDKLEYLQVPGLSLFDDIRFFANLRYLVVGADGPPLHPFAMVTCHSFVFKHCLTLPRIEHLHVRLGHIGNIEPGYFYTSVPESETLRTVIIESDWPKEVFADILWPDDCHVEFRFNPPRWMENIVEGLPSPTGDIGNSPFDWNGTTRALLAGEELPGFLRLPIDPWDEDSDVDSDFEEWRRRLYEDSDDTSGEWI